MGLNPYLRPRTAAVKRMPLGTVEFSFSLSVVRCRLTVCSAALSRVFEWLHDKNFCLIAAAEPKVEKCQALCAI